jgi:transcriptional regulator with XRE-family HTH domain
MSRLAKWRKNKGYTQAELAGLIGRSQPLIAAWESGDRSPNADDRVTTARILGVPVEDLWEPMTPTTKTDSGEAA